ncbi:MAG: hypothetical protein MUD15_07355 [Desulfobacterota bacterium]|nr:hypothetical protein [Thermodesulfobacteriota bacterium]
MNILDPRFRYTPSAQTDIRETFARERQRLAAEAAATATGIEVTEHFADADEMVALGAADLHPRLPAWMAAMAADERADLDRAMRYLDADDRR